MNTILAACFMSLTFITFAFVYVFYRGPVRNAYFRQQGWGTFVSVLLTCSLGGASIWMIDALAYASAMSVAVALPILLGGLYVARKMLLSIKTGIEMQEFVPFTPDSNTDIPFNSAKNTNRHIGKRAHRTKAA